MTDREICARLEKLERDNRRLKRCGLALLAMLVALTTIYATRPVPDVIKAHGFDVVDSADKVRIRLRVSEPQNATDSAEINFLDSSGKERIALEQIGAFDSLHFADEHGNDTVRMMGTSLLTDSSEIDLFAGEAVGRAGISSTGYGTQQISLSMNPLGQPTISLADAKGFSMDLGSTDTVTPASGATQKTSAASIIMFGNDSKHRVIWKAP